ncbi:hypothetical protein [Agrobacterium tumefaciens]|uniref:hypothetical protein n=1 Tax=Agrobacterium tumefaciens TaxID=358 RepID=UPI0021D321EE|nr:hypothetical protein [Agrobacterium tumefaciens]UXS55794.1 hypothetical protein FY148_24425 [Agrobacterium tumefaciens]UXS64236.1 hypothetical protein FY147_14765 [Agrobacterium tumefaciens]
MNTILVPLFLIGARSGIARLRAEAFMPKQYWRADVTVSRQQKTREACHSLRAPLPSPHHGYAACNIGTWLQRRRDVPEVFVWNT